jgi:hypothetical protein
LGLLSGCQKIPSIIERNSTENSGEPYSIFQRLKTNPFQPVNFSAYPPFWLGPLLRFPWSVISAVCPSSVTALRRMDFSNFNFFHGYPAKSGYRIPHFKAYAAANSLRAPPQQLVNRKYYGSFCRKTGPKHTI